MNGTLEAAGGDRSAACHDDRSRINDPSLPMDVDAGFPVRRFARCFSVTM
jgi:hypothetical protein